ncbi:phytanoyl-CoA dioxygenase family protein [Flavisphingomonas formosensis]|uniref:phytanoyl-CoA dioxygenase family protein n=1 Tax=Flavisphingomonas formosensis TaxID=861534 RepID=UPI0012F79CAF|nr:phytanoyl-CoA dioxygenase family protein [Sphingomonas formosensis]
MSVIEADARAASYLSQLLELGYCVIPDLMQAALVDELARDLRPHFEQAVTSKGPFYGEDTKRFGGLLSRSDRMAAFVQHGLVLSIVEAVLGPWCDRIALNLTQAIELMPHSVDQVPHRDQDMWPCSKLIAPDLSVEFLVNVMWPFVPYSEANGATRIWPGSHRRQNELLMDPSAAICPTLAPGSALLFLGSTLHAGGANRTEAPRRGMIVSYTLGWLKPYELQWLAYPPEIARRFPEDLTALLGYHIHRPNLGNVDGRCPSGLLRAHHRDGVGAVDALRPEQLAIIAQYRSGLPSPEVVGEST